MFADPSKFEFSGGTSARTRRNLVAVISHLAEGENGAENFRCRPERGSN
jgi:hypothetical protein